MKILPLNSVNIQKNKLNSLEFDSKTVYEEKTIDIGSYNTISFQGSYLRYLNAKKYVTEIVKPRLEKHPKKVFDLWDFDLRKLEGIQYGIKVFKNMSIKEVAFFLSTVMEFATFRGCYNNCAHCYANAKPPIKETEKQTAGMTWEDFTMLAEGIKTLNKRLGFYASGRNKRNKQRYLTPFHDSDGMEVFMKDKTGKVYDFMDITKLLYDAMGVKVIFDTASWHPKSKSRQEKAEKYVDFMANPENKKMFDQINISLTPFHAMYQKELELRKENKQELADKIRDLYTTRMANALFTFTPLVKSQQMRFLQTVTKDEASFKGYRHEDLYKLYDEITDKLWLLYSNDLVGEQKYIKSLKKMGRCLEYLDILFERYRYVSFSEKARRILKPNEEITRVEDKKILAGIDLLKDLKQNTLVQNNFVGILDSNGKYYLTNFRFTVPTEIKLNFENNKETAPISPNLKSRVLITKSEIKNL